MPVASVAMAGFSSDVGTYEREAASGNLAGTPVTENVLGDVLTLQDEELRPEGLSDGRLTNGEKPSGQTLRSLFGLTDEPEDEFEEAMNGDSMAVEEPGVPDGAGLETNEELELAVCIKLEALRQEFPDGKYWNNGGVSDSRCKHFGKNYHAECNEYMGKLVEAEGFDMGTQCLGYAAMLSDRLFGEDAPVTLIDDFSQLRPGDHIRFRVEDEDGWTGNHSVLVLSNNGDSVTVTDCNHDFQSCIIRWDAVYTREYLEAHEHRYWTRYTVE